MVSWPDVHALVWNFVLDLRKDNPDLTLSQLTYQVRSELRIEPIAAFAVIQEMVQSGELTTGGK